MRSYVLALLSTGMAAPSRAPAGVVGEVVGAVDRDVPLAALLDRFREIEGLAAEYREEKHMELLVQPLVSSGTLHYARPRRLARHQREPTESRVVIVDDSMWFDDGVSQERLDLAKRPAVRMFVDSVLLVLAGDHTGLSRLYAVKLHKVDDRWSLDLRPRLHPVDKIIKSIEITGRGVVIERMVVLETGGDMTRTEFHAVDTRHRFTPAEMKRVFRLDRPASGAAP